MVRVNLLSQRYFNCGDRKSFVSDSLPANKAGWTSYFVLHVRGHGIGGPAWYTVAKVRPVVHYREN